MATVEEFVGWARGEVGVTENPPGSNRTRYAAEAGHVNGQPWCATFVVAIARRVGLRLPSESAYTPWMARGFRDDRAWHTHWPPKRGDIVFFDFPDSKRRIQHVGICLTADGDTVTCVEGNTSPGVSGSQDNGGGVYVRQRPRRHVVGWGRPRFAAVPPPVFTYADPVEVDGMKLQSVYLKFPVDSNGCGNVKVPHPISRIVGFLPHSEVRPNADGFYDRSPNHVAFTPEGDGTVVVVQGHVPKGEANLWLTVLVD